MRKRTDLRARENIFQDGPHLICALVCEKLLTERDGVKSAVRIVDRFTQAIFTAGTSEAAGIPVIEQHLFLLVKFKKGDAGGDKHEFKLEFVDPSGSPVSGAFSQTIHFDGGPNRGVDFVMPLHLRFEKEGVYWLDVYLDEVRITRIPLEVVIVVRRHAPADESPKRLN